MNSGPLHVKFCYGAHSRSQSFEGGGDFSGPISMSGLYARCSPFTLVAMALNWIFHKTG